MARNKNVVTKIENDGDYVIAQFVRPNGEVVIGDFKRIGWAPDERMPRYQNVVTRISDDDQYIYAQFVRANGEVVVGQYKRVGWTLAPAAVHNDVIKRLRTPVVGMTWPTRR